MFIYCNRSEISAWFDSPDVTSYSCMDQLDDTSPANRRFILVKDKLIRRTENNEPMLKMLEGRLAHANFATVKYTDLTRRSSFKGKNKQEDIVRDGEKYTHRKGDRANEISGKHTELPNNEKSPISLTNCKRTKKVILQRRKQSGYGLKSDRSLVCQIIPLHYQAPSLPAFSNDDRLFNQQPTDSSENVADSRPDSRPSTDNLTRREESLVNNVQSQTVYLFYSIQLSVYL